jgi:hypothetical protein
MSYKNIIKIIKLKNRKIMKHLFLSVSILLIAANAFSQERVANKAIYAELGGGSVIMSFNFDTRFNPHSHLGWGARVGAGFGIGTFQETNTFVTSSYYSFPVQINYLLGRPNSRHTFEIGAGATALTRKVALYYYDKETPGHFIGNLSFVYRIMPFDGGFSFRIGLTPIIGTGGDLYPMAAMSFGYTF